MAANYDEAYQEYEAGCKKRREENSGFLDEFERWLKATGISDKTINKHVRNVDFYLNEYLLREDPCDMESGCYALGDFLGYYFVHKCMWSTPSSVRQNATSFKKFYKCMLQAGHITQDSYDFMMADIKENLNDWVSYCKRYNDSLDDPGSFFDDMDDDSYDPFFDPYLGYEDPAPKGSTGVGQEKVDQGESAAQRLLALFDSLQPARRVPLSEATRDLSLSLLYLTMKEVKTEDGYREWMTNVDLGKELMGPLREKEYLEEPNEQGYYRMTEEGMGVAEDALRDYGYDHLL